MYLITGFVYIVYTKWLIISMLNRTCLYISYIEYSICDIISKTDTNIFIYGNEQLSYK